MPGDTNQVHDVFLRDRQQETTKRASVSSEGNQGNGISGRGYAGNGFFQSSAVATNGRLVAFSSNATNLIANDNNGVVSDVFVRDLGTKGVGDAIRGQAGKLLGIIAALAMAISIAYWLIVRGLIDPKPPIPKPPR